MKSAASFSKGLFLVFLFSDPVPLYVMRFAANSEVRF
jgi:hypothetical protein